MEVWGHLPGESQPGSPPPGTPRGLHHARGQEDRPAPPRPSSPPPRDIPVSLTRPTSDPPLEVHRTAAGTSPGNSEEGTPRRGIPFLHGDSHRLQGLGVLWREVDAATPRPAQAVWEMPGPAGEGALSLREAPSAERSKSFVQGKRERPWSLRRARQRPRTPPAPGMGEDLGGWLSGGLRGPRPASADQRRGLHLKGVRPSREGGWPASHLPLSPG